MLRRIEKIESEKIITRESFLFMNYEGYMQVCVRVEGYGYFSHTIL